MQPTWKLELEWIVLWYKSILNNPICPRTLLSKAHIYGMLDPWATYQYKICCSSPQNAHNLHNLESSIFIGILCSLLLLSDLLESTNYDLGSEGIAKSQNISFIYGYDIGWKNPDILTSKLIQGYKKRNISDLYGILNLISHDSKWLPTKFLWRSMSKIAHTSQKQTHTYLKF